MRSARVFAAVIVVTLAVPLVALASHSEVSPSAVPVGFLAAHSELDDLPADAFARVARPAGAEVFIQHVQLGAGRATAWHTHPGPVIVSVEGGSMVVEDGHGSECRRHHYEDGDSFVDAGFGHVHRAVAGPDGVDFYAVYLVPADTEAVAIVQPAPGPCQQ